MGDGVEASFGIIEGMVPPRFDSGVENADCGARICRGGVEEALGIADERGLENVVGDAAVGEVVRCEKDMSKPSSENTDVSVDMLLSFSSCSGVDTVVSKTFSSSSKV
jgi:hypothetical protein